MLGTDAMEFNYCGWRKNERKSPETGSEAEFILEHYWG